MKYDLYNLNQKILNKQCLNCLKVLFIKNYDDTDKVLDNELLTNCNQLFSVFDIFITDNNYILDLYFLMVVQLLILYTDI